jgi:hypothetical protein
MKEDKRIWMEELQQLEVKALPTQKAEPFAAPEAFFESFPARLQERLQDEEAFAEDSPLRQAGKREPFEAPKGYFDTLEERVLQQTQGQGGARIRPLFPQWRTASLAAAILILIIGSWLVFSPPLPSQDLTSEDLISLALEEGVDAYAIAEVFDLSEVQEPTVPTLSQDELDQLLEEVDISEMDLEEIFSNDI